MGIKNVASMVGGWYSDGATVPEGTWNNLTEENGVITNKQKDEYNGVISRACGLMRLDHIAHFPAEYKQDAMKKVDQLEKDLYDILDGKEEEVTPEPVKVEVKQVTPPEEEVQELSGCDSFSLDQCESRPQWRGQI